MTDDALPTQAWPQVGVGSRAVPQPRREAAIKRFFASIGFVLDSVRRRRSGRIALWGVVVVLAGAGLWMVTYPFFTDIWAGRKQDALQQEFQKIDPAHFGQGTLKEGDAVTRLIIPKLNVNVIVVHGWSPNALRAGAGLKPGSALPGDALGNVAIAGHRTGFGEPFRHLDRLKPGDQVILETPVGRFSYETVEPFDGHGNPWITTPSDLSVVGGTPYGALTLVTCDPPRTSKNRLIARLRLMTAGSAATIRPAA